MRASRPLTVFRTRLMPPCITVNGLFNLGKSSQKKIYKYPRVFTFAWVKDWKGQENQLRSSQENHGIRGQTKYISKVKMKVVPTSITRQRWCGTRFHPFLLFCLLFGFFFLHSVCFKRNCLCLFLLPYSHLNLCFFICMTSKTYTYYHY